MANIINGSFEKPEPSYIISNEIKFLEKSQEAKCYNSNVLVIFFSPIIAIIIGKFISLLNIIGIILIKLLKDRDNFNEIIKLAYENVVIPAMNTPENIIKEYPKLWKDFMEIINSYFDIYFYANLFYFLTLIVAFMFILVLMKDRDLFRFSFFDFIKTNIINIIIVFALGFVSSLVICFLISSAGGINFLKQDVVNNIFKLRMMSLINVIVFAFIHEFIFRYILSTYFWQKLRFIDKKIERYIFLNIILIASSILFVIAVWGINFLLIFNFILMSIFYRILTSISNATHLNIGFLVALNLVGTFIFGYPILSFKNQYNLIGNTISNYSIYSGGGFGILGSIFSTIIFSLLIAVSLIFYRSLIEIIKKH